MRQKPQPVPCSAQNPSLLLGFSIAFPETHQAATGHRINPPESQLWELAQKTPDTAQGALAQEAKLKLRELWKLQQDCNFRNSWHSQVHASAQKYQSVRVSCKLFQPRAPAGVPPLGKADTSRQGAEAPPVDGAAAFWLSSAVSTWLVVCVETPSNTNAIGRVPGDSPVPSNSPAGYNTVQQPAVVLWVTTHHLLPPLLPIILPGLFSTAEWKSNRVSQKANPAFCGIP